MPKSILEGGGEPGTWTPTVTPEQRQQNLQGAVAKVQDALNNYKPFTPVKTITNQYGEKVAVDSTGRDVNGNLVIQQETIGKTETKRFYLGTGKDRYLVVQYDDGSEQQTPAPAGGESSGGGGSANAATRATLQAWLTTFFNSDSDAKTISDLMNFVDSQIQADVPAEAIMLNMRNQKFYQERFSGNEALRKKGLAELSPSEYLAVEQKYSQLLGQYNLQRLATRSNFSSLISGEVSSVELEDRLTNVYQRIVNADADLSKEIENLKTSTNLTNADFAESLLLGKEGVASLKRKIAMAEISAEFTPRGLKSALGVEELANLGITRQQAAAGAEFTKIGTENISKLADIYGAQKSGIQAELETEAFKGLESQRRKKLTEQEKAAYSGSSGIGTPSLTTSAAGRL